MCSSDLYPTLPGWLQNLTMKFPPQTAVKIQSLPLLLARVRVARRLQAAPNLSAEVMAGTIQAIRMMKQEADSVGSRFRVLVSGSQVFDSFRNIAVPGFSQNILDIANRYYPPAPRFGGVEIQRALASAGVEASIMNDGLGQEYMIPGDWHLNPTGSQVYADRLADLIVREKWPLKK